MTAPLLITVLFFKKSLIFLETLKSWFLPFLDIFACQQILKEPSCEAVTESFFFSGLFGWITKAGASCLSDRPTTCSLMWLGRFSLEDYFPDQAVSPNTDILSTGRPKLSYSPGLWHSRLFSLTMEPRNVTPGLVLCEINRWCSVLIRLWARGKYPRQNLSQTAVVWFTRRISVCKCIRI